MALSETGFNPPAVNRSCVLLFRRECLLPHVEAHTHFASSLFSDMFPCHSWKTGFALRRKSNTTLIDLIAFHDGIDEFND